MHQRDTLVFHSTSRENLQGNKIMVLFCYSPCIYYVVLSNTLLYKLGPSFNTNVIDHGSSLRINYGMVAEASGNYMRSSHHRKGEANFEFYKNAQYRICCACPRLLELYIMVTGQALGNYMKGSHQRK
jgi:hypothetical protein